MPGKQKMSRLERYGIYHIMEWHTQLSQEKFVGGTSLNKQLIVGPDLTNQLVGVLSRFRKEHIAYMAGIEAIFHQARVPDRESEKSGEISMVGAGWP